MTDGFELSFGQVRGFFRRGLLIAIGLGVLLGAGLYQWSSGGGPSFRSQAVLVTASPSIDLRTLGLPELNEAPLHVDAYSVAASSDAVLAAALNDLGMPAAQSDVDAMRRDRLQVRVASEAKLIYITVTADSPTAAADQANAVAKELQTWDSARSRAALNRITTMLTQRLASQQLRVQQLEQQPGTLADQQGIAEQLLLTQLAAQLDSVIALSNNSGGTLNLLRAATPQDSDVGRSPFAFAALGLLLGVIVGYGLTLVLEVFDGRVYTEEGVERATDLPVLAALPRPRRGRLLGPDASIVLQANLDTQLGTLGRTVLLVTSVAYSDDTATAAMALAETYARQGKRTLLVDADLHHPAIARRYRVPGINNATLINSIRGVRAHRPARIKVDDSHLSLIFEPKAATEHTIAMVQGFGECLLNWMGEYEAIVVRAAPMSVSNDSLLLGKGCSGTVLAVDPRSTNRQRLQDAVARLQRAGVELVGTVVTGGHRRFKARQQAPARVVNQASGAQQPSAATLVTDAATAGARSKAGQPPTS